MKYFLIGLLLLASGLAYARDTSSDSGLYFNPDRDGEGLALHRSGKTVAAFVFTYGGAEAEVPQPIGPFFSPQIPLDEPLNGQRWFMISGDPLIGDVATGILYITGGVNYPDVLQPLSIGTAEAVGNYELSRNGDGWDLIVVRSSGSRLAADDPLYTVDFSFDTLLFESGD